MIYFITRHPGAREWAEQQGLRIDSIIDHLESEQIHPGDTVIGSLPVNLAAEVCAHGGRYLHLSLDLPAEARGRELSADDMQHYGARLEAYHIKQIT